MRAPDRLECLPACMQIVAQDWLELCQRVLCKSEIPAKRDSNKTRQPEKVKSFCALKIHATRVIA